MHGVTRCRQQTNVAMFDHFDMTLDILCCFFFFYRFVRLVKRKSGEKSPINK